MTESLEPRVAELTAERDQLRATVERVGKLADEWADQYNDCTAGTTQQREDGRTLRKVLRGDR